MPLGSAAHLTGGAEEDKPNSGWTVVFTVEDAHPDPIFHSTDIDVVKGDSAQVVAEALARAWNSAGHGSEATASTGGGSWNLNFSMQGHQVVEIKPPTVPGLNVTVS